MHFLAALRNFYFLIFLAAIATPVPLQCAVRSVEGSVTDKHGNKLPGAVVYIENSQTLLIRTYIVQRNGIFQFHELNPDIDYTLTAKYRKYTSKQHTLSRFDGHRHVVLNLVIPAE